MLNIHPLIFATIHGIIIKIKPNILPNSESLATVNTLNIIINIIDNNDIPADINVVFQAIGSTVENKNVNTYFSPFIF